MSSQTRALIDKLEQQHELSPDEWERLISARTPALADELFASARRVRDAAYGRDVFVRGLIEISSYCKNDCLYCGIRRSNREASRYRLTDEEILACCETGYNLGFRTFVLQGGEDGAFGDERLAPLVSRIREAHPDCAITLSLGERSRASYKRLREAGADRYLLRHETADAAHYASLHPAPLSHEARLRCLHDLRDLGYQVGSGFMVGSPGQTARHLAADMTILKGLNPHMVGIGPFIPHRHTPCAESPAGTLELSLFMLGCLRLMLPHALLPATTALGTLTPEGRHLGLDAGANVLMPNLSPIECRGAYNLYDGKASTGLEGAEGIAGLKAQLESWGYRLKVDRGDSLVR